MRPYYRTEGLCVFHGPVFKGRRKSLPKFPATLQPLIENALFHGIEPKGCAGKIRISANLDREAARQPRLIISVWDNGIGMDAETIKRVLSGTQKPTADFFRQVGINNVNQRIRYDCGPEYGISIESVPGEYTCMHITLPYETAQGEIL